MEYIALAVGVLGLAAAWLARGKAQQLEARLDAANDRIFALMNRMREIDEQTQEQLAGLRVEVRRQAGSLKFEPQMTIQETTEMHPSAADVLASFHLGGCSSCAVHPDQTLSDATQQHGVNLEQLLGALRALADGPSTGSGHAPSSSASPTGRGPGGDAAPRRAPDPDLRIIA